MLRFFCFSNGYGNGSIPTPVPIQPQLGLFLEKALLRVDWVLAQGKKYHLHFILPLVNFEPAYGGMQWYVDERLGPGKDKELFYTDKTVRNDFKNYVRMLVNRKNTLTHIAYKNDPTILAWELSNEVHTTDLYEKNRSMPPGKLVLGWITEMSAFIKQLGVQQMVSTGEEGYRTDGNTQCCHNNWINGGYKGVDFVRNSHVPHIDFATVHVYPDNWGFEPSEYKWVIPNVIADRAHIAHKAGKPIILEETGMQRGYLPSRNTLLDALYGAANKNGYAGTLVWQVIPGAVDDRTYDFNYTQAGSAAVLRQYRFMNKKSRARPPPLKHKAVGG